MVSAYNGVGDLFENLARIPAMSSTTTQDHQLQAPKSVDVCVLTVSDTRSLETDQGGQWIEAFLLAAGHRVLARRIVPDERDRIVAIARELLDTVGPQAILVTGGTGLAARDQTTEAIESLYDAVIPGYGELFRMLSFQEIGPAAMLSRASAGRVGRKVVITMPGSPSGVRLAMERLILPELPHLVFHTSG
jgi:molybdenum cofactor biosynthesis protein B